MSFYKNIESIREISPEQENIEYKIGEILRVPCTTMYVQCVEHNTETPRLHINTHPDCERCVFGKSEKREPHTRKDLVNFQRLYVYSCFKCLRDERSDNKDTIMIPYSF